MDPLEDSDDDDLNTIISRDKKLDVYVKEVWKNSGRFTLTIDSTINKSKILELKERVKNDGLERRRARRLRRQLAHVATGDTVSGVVGGINDNGDIIVTITSLGALNISGIITKHDLPKQFEVPPDLKMNFQKQLLAQDFVCGRSITCGVINVNQNIGQKASHHLRLMFEEFGALPTDNDSPLSAVLDSFEVLNEEDTSLLSKIQNDDENDERDDDVKEIYEELKGASSNLTVENFKSWGDLLDMIEEGSFEMKTLDNALNKVGATDILEFDQFAEVLEILQDSLDGLDSNDDMDDDDMDDDGMEGDEYLEDDITEQIIAQRKVDNRSGKIITAEKNEDFDDLNQEEGNFTKIASEMYDELKGSSMSLSVAKFKAWSDVKEMLDAGVFTEEDLDAGLRAVGTTNEVLNYDQFLSLVQRLDDIAILSDNEDTDGLDEWNVKDAVEVLPNSKGFARNEQSTTTRDVDENNDHALDLSENELQESLVELYNDLKGSDPQLSVKSFLEWDDLLEMKQLDLIDDEIIHNILKETGVVDSKYLSLKQFISMITMLDDIVETTSNNDEDLSMHEVDEIDRLEQPKEGETLDKDTLKEIYRDLGEVVTLESIKAWEDLVELREEGIIDDDTIEALLEAAGIASSSTVTFEGFSEFARLLEETVDAVDKNDSSLDLKDAPLKGMESSDEDENVLGLTDEEFNEMTQEIFDALRGKAKTVSIKKFLAWDDLKGMIDDGLVSKNQIELFATQVGASDHLTFEQFKQVFNKIDEVTSDSEADTKIFNERLDDLGSTSDSLEISEIYDELKSGDMLTVQEFMNWEDVTDIMKLGILKKETLSEMLSEVGAETELSLDQFGQLFQLIEDSMSAADEGTGYLMTEDGDGKKDVKQETKKDAVQEEELTHEELEQMALDIFDGLRGKKKNVVTAKKLMKWEGISDAIADGLVTKTAVQKILAKFDVANTNEFTFDQFKLIMDEIEEVIDSNYDNQDERSPELTTGKGFGANTTQKQKDSDYETSIDDADKVTQEIFDDLRGANTLLPVQTFKEWDDMTDLIENGSIKRSTLEKAIVKVGAYESGKMTYEQFAKLIDIIMNSIDPSQLSLATNYDDDVETANKSTRTSSKGKVLHETPIDEEEDEILDEKTAKSIFNELRGAENELSIVDFLQWEDIQDLLDSKALSEDDLAICIEKVGIEVDQKGQATKTLNFVAFYDLLQLIDTYINHSNLHHNENGQENVDEEDVDDLKLIKRLEDSMEDDEFVGITANREDDFDGEDDLDSNAENDLEILEMFQEISKGKETITTKQLMKWDEIQELISSDLVSEEVVNEYIKKLDLGRDKILDLNKFTEFIGMLDNVLVDEDGNFVAEGGINLDELEFHEDADNDD